MQKHKREGVLSVAFKGSPERLARLKEILDRLLEEADEGRVDPAGPVSDWGQSGGWVQESDGWPQSGGWYLVLEDEPLRRVRPDESLERVTKNVYEALTKAEQIG